jgi:hypothetical protein
MAAGVQISDINWIALLAAMGASIVLGFLWYAPFSPTGKAWMKALKMPADFKPDPKKMMLSYGLMLLGSFFMFFVFMHTFIAYHDAYLLDDKNYKLTIMDGVVGGVMTTLGFIVPVQFGNVTWENKPWSLFWVNTLYYLVALVLAGIIYVAMGL